MSNIITVERNTSESSIVVELDFDGVKNDYRKDIDTNIPFLNHMIEHIAWRSGVNIKVSVKLDEFELSHLICEDVGTAMGKAFAEYIYNNSDNGIKGFGDSIGIIDEAMAMCAISYEGRSYIDIDYKGVEIPKETENMLSEDLETFIDGFVQGASCTMHINLLKGKNGHHIWEAIYRAFGSAMADALKLDNSRKGMTAGVAGKAKFKITK